MNSNYVVGGVVVVLLLAVGIGAAVYYGVGPAPGGSESEDVSDFPTATATADGSGDSGSDSTAQSSAFLFSIDNIEECGQTCRDVTATLHNEQNETATGVTVYTKVFAGENNTAADDRVWEGKSAVGTVAAGGSHTTTERVELSLMEANKIQQRDGWITILTTVQSDERTVTFRDSEQVA